jgi:hypothetical protein
MDLAQFAPQIIAGAGGGALNILLAFNKRFNAWLDRFTPQQRFYIVGAISALLGALLVLALSCAGVLHILNCDRDVPAQLAAGAVSGWTGNQVVYNGVKAAAKTTTQTAPPVDLDKINVPGAPSARASGGGAGGFDASERGG